jgi:hypothetical protein
VRILIINQPSKKKKLPVVASLLSVSLLAASLAMAAGTSTASIRPGSSSATGSTVTATGSSGSLTVSSAGPTYYVQGYAKRSISFFPDTNAASITALPARTVTTGFSATSGNKYYSKANTQSGATSIYGEAKTKVN